MTTADEALGVMERMAKDMAAASPGCTLDKRTYTHVIDPTPWFGAGYQARIRLLVMAKFGAFSEEMALYGKHDVAARYPRVHLEYLTHFESHTVPLKRGEAVHLLATGELPFALRERPAKAEDDDWDVSAYIRSDANKTGHGLRRASAEPRTFRGAPLR